MAEFMFDIKAIGMGLIVCRPIHSGTCYDRIVDNGSRIYRVQIKSAWSKPKDRNFRFMLTKNNNGAYKKNEVDVFACYVSEGDCWYITPNNSKRTLSVVQTEYKENWSIFEKV